MPNDHRPQGKSLDARLITEEPELMLAHLKARRANEEQLSSVSDIGGALKLNGREPKSLAYKCVWV